MPQLDRSRVAALLEREQTAFRSAHPRSGELFAASQASLFGGVPMRSEAAAAGDQLLEDYLHLAALNRGVLLTPFHNMALMAPATTETDVDRHTEVFRETVRAMTDAGG